MFKRLTYEEWQAMIPVIAFLLTFAGVLVFSLRALFMRRESAERLSALPLEDASTSASESKHV